jgi:outer membrane protein insertion porin family
MKTKSQYSLLLSSLIIGFFTLSFTRVVFGQENIVRIDIEGNKRVETDLIKINVSSKVGEPISKETVSSDIKRLYKLGFFEDVSAEVKETTEGLVLVYVVKEKPVVVDLRVRGNKKIKTDKILNVIEVKEGRIIELDKVQKSSAAIKKLYSDEGYAAADVSYDIEPKTEGTVGLTFNITEGKKAYVKEVNIVGNEALKTKEVKEAMQTKPKWTFTFITNRGLYKQEELERDSDRIRALYLDNGYIDVKVSKPEIVFSKEKDGFIVTYRIDEGKQFTVKDVKVEGDLITSEEELMKLLGLKSGVPFNRSAVGGDITKLTTFYGDKGYAFANVDPSFKIDREHLTVDINFVIEKGKEIYVRNIDISGNLRTRDGVIRREIPIQEQQLYSTSKVEAIKPRVTRLGYFEENVDVTTDRAPGTDDQLDVNVKLKEKPTGFFSVAGGFSTVETFIFAGQIQESNLFGYGKTISLSAQIGGITRLFYANYSDPHFLDTNWQFDVLGFQTDRDYQDFSRFAYGGSVTFGREILRYQNGILSGRVTYRFEHVDTDNIDEEAFLLISDTPRNISSFTAAIVWDSRNNLIDPTSGNITRLGIEYAGGPLGGNTDFIRYSASTRFFFPFVLGTVFSVAGRYGLIDFRNLGNEIIVTERYYLGGPNDLRGFEYRRVGPRVPTDDGGFVIIGGVQELYFTAEYIFPLLPRVGFKGVVFFDMGNAFNDGQTLSFDPRDLRKDYGFGIRWVSPLGPLRFEVGFPIGQLLPGEDPYEIQFTVGTLF